MRMNARLKGLASIILFFGTYQMQERHAIDYSQEEYDFVIWWINNKLKLEGY